METEYFIPPIPIGRRRSTEAIFHRFFEMGLEESASPFLDRPSRNLSKNLALKSSLVAALLLAGAYACVYQPLLVPIASVLLAAVYLIVGVPALITSCEDLFLKKDVNIDVLMTLAAFSSFIVGSGYEGALLLVLFALSGAIEDAVTLKAKSSLSALHSLSPTKASLVQEDGEIVERAVQDVEIESRILVRAGEIVPLDGTVVEGASLVSLEHLTGESVPVRKAIGDNVPSGAQVIDGVLHIWVTHTSGDSTVARIIQLITFAKEAKPRLELWFDRFSNAYALTIIALSCTAAFALAPLLGIPYLGNEGSVYRALAFLIAASPCALILAVPIAYLSSLGSCAKRGIVLKGGKVLDQLNECRTVAFDKTGTLTLGELILTDVVSVVTSDDLTTHDALAVAASLEQNASHPVAKAIARSARADLRFHCQDVRTLPGLGVEGHVLVRDSLLYSFVGDLEHVRTLLPETEQRVFFEACQRLREQGLVVAGLYISGEKPSCYLVALQDRPRPQVARMVEHLEKSGRRVLMLTGDHEKSARLIASEVGVKEFEAELTPEDKLRRVRELSSHGGLAMVGDGINDAPALAYATVGICMGQAGSGVAKDVASVILLRDNIEWLDWLFQQAAVTRKIVIQNLVIAASAIVGASIPALAGLVPLWLAVILHEGGTVCVGLNALRLLQDRGQADGNR